MKFKVTGVFRYWHDGLLTDPQHSTTDPDASYVVSLSCLEAGHRYEVRLPVPKAEIEKYRMDSVWDVSLQEVK